MEDYKRASEEDQMRHREQEEKFNGTIEVISESISHTNVLPTAFLGFMTPLEY